MLSVGLIEGFAEAVASLLKTYSGSLSDRIGKRIPFIWIGYLLAAIGKPLTGLATSWTHVLIARGIDRTGKGLRTSPRDALLADSVSKEVRGAAFGWHRSMDTLGAAVGPLLAFSFLTYNAMDLRPLYFWAFIPGLIAVLIVFTLKEQTPVRIREPKNTVPWTLKNSNRNFKIYLGAWLVFSIANSSDVFLLLKAHHAGISLKLSILMYCFYNLVYAVFSPYLGQLSDRIGRKKILICGLFVFALVYIGFSIATAPFHYWILFGIYGSYMAATDGVGKAFAVDLVPESYKATGIGMLATVTGISTLIASSVAGFLWDELGAGSTFYYGAAGAGVAIVVLSFIKLDQTA